MKKKFLIATCATIMVMGCAMTANADDLSDGLIGEYLFDGDFKDTVTGKEATAYDAYDGYWAGTDTDPKPVLATDGTRGNVAEMKGLWQHTGYLSLDTSCLSEITDSFSVALWTKANNSKTENNECGADSGLFNFYFSDEVGTSFKFCGLDVSLTPWINDGDGDWLDRTASGVQISTSSWDFVVMTMDFTNGEIDVYVNGEKTYTCNSLGGGTFDSLLTHIQNASEIQVGTLYPWWDVWDYRGYTDDIRMYNRVLSAEEVVTLMDVEKDTTVADAAVVNQDPTVYVQYKKVSDNNYTVRVVGEVTLDGTFSDSVNTSYKGAGFRCAKAVANMGTAKAESYVSTVVFKSLVANGVTVEAAAGKYFIVTEITDVPADATFYVNPVYQLSEDGTTASFTETNYTINMADIIK